MMRKNFKIFLISIIFLFIPFFVSADYLSQQEVFNVDSTFDLKGRSQISATLIKITPQIYFYIENDWWQKLDYETKQQVEQSLTLLGSEFYYKIYPVLTINFGSEWKPGIDNDEHITVLFHLMKEGRSGYFNSGDEYSKLQVPTSNEREMLYLNANLINDQRMKGFLAHEFIHLITFNQKNRKHNVREETWLNEARAEAAITFLGYDDNYEGSNLEQRVKDFLTNPSDSLTEWKGKVVDYGVSNLFIQYLVDHYGIKILTDSLKLPETGIESLNKALRMNGFQENFSKIFTDWTLAVLLNDCQINEKYCYKNENLKNFRITPIINFLPIAKETTLATTQTTKNWSGNWLKFIGGRGELRFEFDGEDGVIFKVPYLIQDMTGEYFVSFLDLDEGQRGEISISSFNKEKLALIVIPSIQSKMFGFNGNEESFSFFWRIITSEEKEAETELIKKLLAQIDYLQKEIARLQAKIAEILAERGQKISCGKFERNLYFGMMNNPEVRCLQEFLKSQGTEIYPEGLVTGNFLSLTKKAVIRFQEKYAEEILKPLGLESGTGYVGPATRAKINQLLGY